MSWVIPLILKYRTNRLSWVNLGGWFNPILWSFGSFGSSASFEGLGETSKGIGRTKNARVVNIESDFEYAHLVQRVCVFGFKSFHCSPNCKGLQYTKASHSLFSELRRATIYQSNTFIHCSPNCKELQYTKAIHSFIVLRIAKGYNIPKQHIHCSPNCKRL